MLEYCNRELHGEHGNCSREIEGVNNKLNEIKEKQKSKNDT